MAFYTNYNGFLSDGELIEAGLEKHVLLRRVFDAIITATDGEWLEVTGAGPTPTALQTHASNIASGVTNSTSPSTGDQCTMYWASDPNIGSEESRLVRFEIANSSISLFAWELIMDSAVRNDLFHSFASAGNPDSLFSDVTGISNSAASTTTNPLRLFVFGDTDYLIVLLYDTVTGETCGCVGFYYPADVEGFERTDLAYFWEVLMAPGDTSSQSLPVVHCAPGSVTPGASSKVLNHYADDNTPNESTESFGYPFSRMELFQTSTYASHVMQLPRLRVVEAGAVGNELLEFEADSATWLVLSIMDGVAVCIDITPEMT